MKILFVGNSYTYVNDVPALVAQLAEENGVDAEVCSVTKGGWKLHRYLDLQDEYAEKFEQAMKIGPYDAVILQEQSLTPLLNYAQFADGVKRVAERVAAGRTILYQTWGRKEGSPDLETYGWSRNEMTDRLAEAYHKAAAAIGAELSPVGTYFWQANQRMPDLELYHSDLTHPSYAGSCLAALSHYKILFGQVPQKMNCLNLPDAVKSLYRDIL